MVGVMGESGSYRRAVMAVAITGTVCAGLGFALYLGSKKLRDKRTQDDAETEPEETDKTGEGDQAGSTDQDASGPVMPSSSGANKDPTRPKVPEIPADIKKPEKVSDSKIPSAVKESADKVKEKVADVVKAADSAAASAKDTTSAKVESTSQRAAVEDVMTTVAAETRKKLESAAHPSPGAGKKQHGDASQAASKGELQIVKDAVSTAPIPAPVQPVGQRSGAGDARSTPSKIPVAKGPDMPPGSQSGAAAVDTSDVTGDDSLPSLGDDIEIIDTSVNSVKSDEEDSGELSNSIEFVKHPDPKEEKMEKEPKADKAKPEAKSVSEVAKEVISAKKEASKKEAVSAAETEEETKHSEAKDSQKPKETKEVKSETHTRPEIKEKEKHAGVKQDKKDMHPGQKEKPQEKKPEIKDKTKDESLKEQSQPRAAGGQEARQSGGGSGSAQASATMAVQGAGDSNANFDAPLADPSKEVHKTGPQVEDKK